MTTNIKKALLTLSIAVGSFVLISFLTIFVCGDMNLMTYDVNTRFFIVYAASCITVLSSIAIWV